MLCLNGNPRTATYSLGVHGLVSLHKPLIFIKVLMKYQKHQSFVSGISKTSQVPSVTTPGVLLL